MHWWACLKNVQQKCMGRISNILQNLMIMISRPAIPCVEKGDDSFSSLFRSPGHFLVGVGAWFSPLAGPLMAVLCRASVLPSYLIRRAILWMCAPLPI